MKADIRLSVTIRPAIAADTTDVLELTSHIWDGEDYVPQAWEGWLHDPLGLLLVAEYQGRVVGLAKLSETTPEDWWMQGLRVHPDFEGQGIASRLYDALLDHWHKNGRGSLRLATHFERYQVHHLCQRGGFTHVGTYTFFQASALKDGQADFLALNLEEVNEALEFAQDSPIKDLTLPYMDIGWEWLPPRSSIIGEYTQRGQALWWRERQGLLLFNEDTEEDEQGPIPHLVLLACAQSDLVNLLLDYRRLAGQLGYSNASWSPPTQEELLPILAQAGFERKWDGAVYLFEKSDGL